MRVVSRKWQIIGMKDTKKVWKERKIKRNLGTRPKGLWVPGDDLRVRSLGVLKRGENPTEIQGIR